MLKCFWPIFIVISSYISVNFYEPIYYMPSAFHIFILPKFLCGSYYYSHVVDRYVCYVMDRSIEDVILFSLKSIWIHVPLSPWSGRKLNLSLLGLFYQLLPGDNTKALRVLPWTEVLEKALWFRVHADHSLFAHCSSPDGFLKAS